MWAENTAVAKIEIKIWPEKKTAVAKKNMWVTIVENTAVAKNKAVATKIDVGRKYSCGQKIELWSKVNLSCGQKIPGALAT